MPFAVPEHIGSWMERQFDELARRDFLRSTTPAQFAEGAAGIVNEINAAHPFIDGNGRCQRFWLRMVANGAGLDLTFHESQRAAWNEASRIGFEASKHEPMAALLRSNITSLAREGDWQRAADRNRDRGGGFL